MDKLAALALMQEHHLAWETGNFGPQPVWVPLNGVVEEVGELFRSYLKIFQGIRGDVAKHKADAKDAVGDILVFTVSYCTKMGLRMADIITQGDLGDSPVDEVWTPHQDGLFAVQKAAYRLVEAHITGLDLEEVKARVYGLITALSVFSNNYLDGTEALDHLFLAWDEVKRREWKVNPWNGTSPAPAVDDTKCIKCGADCGFAMKGNICKGCSVEDSPVYSRPECIFNYCNDPEACKTSKSGCLNPSRARIAPPALAESPGMDDHLQAAKEAMTKCGICGTDVGFTSPCPRCRHTPDAPYPNGKDGKGGGMVLDPTLNPGE